MNAYYENKTYGNRIPRTAEIRVGDRLISVICAIVAFLTCSAVVKVGKAAICTALFFSFFGVIGAMDNGSIGMLAGVVLCAATSLFEFLMIKSMVKKPASK